MRHSKINFGYLIFKKIADVSTPHNEEKKPKINEWDKISIIKKNNNFNDIFFFINFYSNFYYKFFIFADY